ncbi:aminomethyl-transferring glycine dehydrogenase subunit GcvPB [Actinomyces provencensis]|uniref:aminomethyl-transferring glycine dehydrogenase subunit GcvPB n=1 Tax=Actinomyces provencensis TaxID=1720198 RepID=UPI00096A58BA|nr:aminomethyl-transferring glycine dehydrogenase subunit GcvPB [Actinomyces provencensis]
MVTPTDDGFTIRHIGLTADADLARALDRIGHPSLESLVEAALPASIRTRSPLDLPAPATEQEVLAQLRDLASHNRPMRQMIGQGFSGTVTPAVIRRNVLENPGWYTAYTPYQPEISQGRLEALITFQTMVADLTALPVANASLLDESSAAAEAMLLMRRANRAHPDAPVLVDTDVFPQTLAVLRGRARAADIDLVEADLSDGLPEGAFAGVIIQQPGDSGRIADWAPVVAAAHERGALVTVVADILSLALITPPGEIGADIAVGSTQRFGVPLFFGGPHAAYMAVTTALTRQIPGRLVGISHDDAGTPALRLALQTREQHIRRERATSNICTAQALLAIVAGMYAVHHGPEGIRAIAERTHAHAARLADALTAHGLTPVSDSFFDTVRVALADEGAAAEVVSAAGRAGINIRRVDATTVSVSTSEETTDVDVDDVLTAFGVPTGAAPADLEALGTGGTERPAGTGASTGAALVDAPVAPDAPASPTAPATDHLPVDLRRTSTYLTHPVFRRYRSETALMRHLRRLADRDLALDRTMIPLGSCTMKLNAAVEMEAISWPGFAGIHPFAPLDQAQGWLALIGDLETWLAEISGYAAVSLQPNGGSQGEYAGLQAIRLYQESIGHPERRICLIPASAHGTNAASAALAGLQVVAVGTAPDGAIDLEDLRAKLAEHEGRVAAIMVTYPSTHGVFEGHITEVCDLVHAAGGQVYIDGANLNALVGLARPGRFGGDVSHLNLHKTFCIPHGGGGPGVGPVAAAAHLAPFLPRAQDAAAWSSPVDEGEATPAGTTPAPTDTGLGGPVAATTYGSAGVLPISWAYIRLMGGAGLTRATQGAILAANYVAASLHEDYPVLYTGAGGLVAHECILDLRHLSHESGIGAEDVAKRLIDYGFHAPTLSFPVPGTLMVEPTESEDLGELDRFVAAMRAIRVEVQEVIDGEVAAEESVVHRAPHTAAALVGDGWERAYGRERAAFPLPGMAPDKYFPPVGRIDGAYGDRHLVLTLEDPEGSD